MLIVDLTALPSKMRGKVAMGLIEIGRAWFGPEAPPMFKMLLRPPGGGSIWK
jgi:hypothetical protein